MNRGKGVGSGLKPPYSIRMPPRDYLRHRGRFIGHVYPVVNGFDASKAFYTTVLAVFGISWSAVFVLSFLMTIDF